MAVHCAVSAVVCRVIGIDPIAEHETLEEEEVGEAGEALGGSLRQVDVAEVPGSGSDQVSVVWGLLFHGKPVTTLSPTLEKQPCLVAFVLPPQPSQESGAEAEATTGRVVLRSPAELRGYRGTVEAEATAVAASLVASNCSVVVYGGTLPPADRHALGQAGIAAVDGVKHHTLRSLCDRCGAHLCG